jgi:hypothetical protein
VASVVAARGVELTPADTCVVVKCLPDPKPLTEVAPEQPLRFVTSSEAAVRAAYAAHGATDAAAGLQLVDATKGFLVLSRQHGCVLSHYSSVDEPGTVASQLAQISERLSRRVARLLEAAGGPHVLWWIFFDHQCLPGMSVDGESTWEAAQTPAALSALPGQQLLFRGGRFERPAKHQLLMPASAYEPFVSLLGFLRYVGLVSFHV